MNDEELPRRLTLEDRKAFHAVLVECGAPTAVLAASSRLIERAKQEQQCTHFAVSWLGDCPICARRL